jgi:hypothetical protein
MFQRIFRAIAGTFVSLALLAPAPALAQTDDEVFDADLYEYTTTDYEFNTISDDYTVTGDEEVIYQVAAIFAGVGVIFLVTLLVVTYLYTSLTLMVIANKVGEGPAWLAWVPVGNLFLMAKVAQLPAISLLLFIVPVVNVVYSIYMMMKVAERRGFESWLGILMIVPVIGLFVPGYIAWAEPTKAK